MEGNAGKADTLYAEAVSRYGLPDETARLLAGLLEMPNLSRDSRKVIQNLMKAR